MTMHKRIHSLLLAGISLTAFGAPYAINFDESATTAGGNRNPKRYVKNIGMTSPSFGAQTAVVNQNNGWKLYHNLAAPACFSATSAEEVTPVIDWNGAYMHGYLYIDYDNSGDFNPETELVSYSYLAGKNSRGENVAESVGPALPSFTLPQLAAGDYRMRYIIDWDFADPMGRNTETNKITENCGAIVDATLRIVSDRAPEGDYAVNFPPSTVINHATRRNTSVSLTATGEPRQTLATGQEKDLLLFHDFSDRAFIVPEGTGSITAEFGYGAGWAGDWMHKYVYVDLNGDGVFDPATELLTCTTTANSEAAQPAAFSLGSGVKPGAYRMRFKIDWDSNDPAGSKSEGNEITKNGGSIVDATLVVSNHSSEESFATGNCTFDGGEIAADGNRTFVIVPDDGCVAEGAKVSCGYPALAAGLTAVNPGLLYHSDIYAAGGDNGCTVTIPADRILGGAEFYFSAIPAAEAPAEGNYEVAYRTPLAAGATLPAITAGGRILEFSSLPGDGYYRCTRPVNATSGSVVEVTCEAGEGKNVDFLLDLNMDGTFYANTLSLVNEKAAAESSGGIHTARINVPTAVGVYRARVEIDGKQTADFFINVHGSTAAVSPMAMNGLMLAADGSPLPETIAIGSELKIKITPALPGFETSKVIVRHGQNLNGAELIKGNPQWADLELNLPADGLVTIPADAVNGDIAVYAMFEEQEAGEWTKIWGDEFNNGRMDSSRWGYHPRYGATWNRLIAKTDAGRKQVNKFGDGCYNAYAIANDIAAEDAEMITGAICSQGKFSVKYGRLEARIKTLPHVGNFPAFWLMPASSELREYGLNGWPQDGEIDIWEQVNDSNQAHHTVHSGWTGWKDYLQGAGASPSGPWPAPKQNSPANTGNHNLDAAAWHVIALEWDSESLRWFVDGVHKFTYENKHYTEEGSDFYFDKVTWPFSKEFYIILNQSVGQANGWAKAPDLNFTYHTRFDYVRVYQKKGENGFTSSLKGNGDDPDFFIPAQGLPEIETSIENISAEPEATNGPAVIYDINGRIVPATSALHPGIYIEKRGTSARKIIVK